MSKNILHIIIILLWSTQFITAQQKPAIASEHSEVKDDTLVYAFSGIEVKPEFRGGIEALNQFFRANFKMPRGEKVKRETVAVFFIEKDGSLSNIKVLPTVGPETEKEAIRVLKLAPKWSPGIQNGKIVRMHHAVTLPIPIEQKSYPRRK